MKKWYSIYLEDDYTIFQLKKYLRLVRIPFDTGSCGDGVVISVYADETNVTVINEYLDKIA